MMRNQGEKSGCFAGSHFCGAKLQKSDGLQRPSHGPGEMVKMIFAMILNIVILNIVILNIVILNIVALTAFPWTR